MSKNLRLNILKYLKANGGEYENIDITPIILKSVEKVSRSNIKSVLKDLKNEGFIEGSWSGLSFLNNPDGSMKEENDISVNAKIIQKGITYLQDQKLKSRQTLFITISIISIILTLIISLYSIYLKTEISNLENHVSDIENRVSTLETNQNGEVEAMAIGK